MKRKITLLLPVLVLAASLALVSSCKDESDPAPTNNNNTTKTLTKSQLYDKRWYDELGSSHYFYSDGKYDDAGGSWKWINESDTMEIILYSGGNTLTWIFGWSTEHEMSCKLSGDKVYTLYKDEPW